MSFSAENTLPDDAWKDSFDKLLDQRPVLRELNVIKRDVRASFNMNSSCENSAHNGTASVILNFEDNSMQSNLGIPKGSNLRYLEEPKNKNVYCVGKGLHSIVQSKIVSTPIKSATSNPFKCTLSPIGPWELQHFKRNDKKNDSNSDKPSFNATPINSQIEEVNIISAEKPRNPERYSLGISPLELVRKKWKSKQIRKQICFVDCDLDEKTNKSSKSFNQDLSILMPVPLLCPKLDLQPGKWRKSLNCLRRKQIHIKENIENNETLEKLKKGRSIDFVGRSSNVAANRKSIFINRNGNLSQIAARSTYSIACNDFKRQILQRCEQSRILTFGSTYNEKYLRNCRKIGEGAYGEVFLYVNPKKMPYDTKDDTDKTVLKVIPIEGKELVNGEIQKTFEQILPEVIISMELSALNGDDSKINSTGGFVNLQRVKCVKGQYPTHLTKLWEDYDLRKKSENDHPKCFNSNQIYVVLELSYGGQDLESFNFKNAEQSFSALQQIILTLAVGEQEYQFEHRDLHWGNVLILNTDQEYITYKLDGNILTIPSQGIRITIIDYTLSRMTFNDYCFYNDLSTDEELFAASGDYQFDIYRMIRSVLNNKWDTFEPKTNIFWISYIISKLFKGVQYKNTRSKKHLHYLDKLQQLQSTILTYNSCMHYARDGMVY